MGLDVEYVVFLPKTRFFLGQPEDVTISWNNAVFDSSPTIFQGFGSQGIYMCVFSLWMNPLLRNMCYGLFPVPSIHETSV